MPKISMQKTRVRAGAKVENGFVTFQEQKASKGRQPSDDNSASASSDQSVFGDMDMSKIEGTRFFLTWIRGGEYDGLEFPGLMHLPTERVLGTTGKFKLDITQQYSARRSFAVLKSLASYVKNTLENNPRLKERTYGSGSVHLNLILELVENFVKRAQNALKNGAVAFREQFDIESLNMAIFFKDRQDRDLADDEEEDDDDFFENLTYSFTSEGLEYRIATIDRLLQDRGENEYLEPGMRNVLQAIDFNNQNLWSGDRTENYVFWEEDLQNDPQNMLDVKTLFDQILDAEARLKVYEGLDELEQTRAQYVKVQPPFYPTLSEMEFQRLTSWQNAVKEMRQIMLSDPTYQFAVEVAGLMVKGTTGVEQLLSNKTMAPSFERAYPEIPSSGQERDFVSSDRDQLFRMMFQLENAIEQQRAQDMIEEQRRLNEFEIPDFEDGGQDIAEYQTEFAKFIQQNNAQRRDGPQPGSIIAKREDVPLSLASRRLMNAKEQIETMLMGTTMSTSRERMLHALEWLQKAEVLKRAEMTPVFTAGIRSAMADVKMFCPRLRNIADFQAFSESPDAVAKTHFARLVALHIADFESVFPKRNYLDKRFKQVNDRKRRLISTMSQTLGLGPDGKVRSMCDMNEMERMQFNAATYAFTGF